VNPPSLATEIALIEKFFRDYRIGAAVHKRASFMAGKSFAVLGVSLGPGTRISALENRMPEMSEVLSGYRGIPTPLRLRKLPLAIEIPHPAAEPLFATAGNLHIPAHSMLLGKSFGYEGERDEVLRFDDAPHSLIAGTTGSGKSKLLELMIYTLAMNTSPHELELVFVDLKNEELVPFADLPHTSAMALSLEDAEETIADVYARKNARVRTGRGKYKRLVLVIDELAEMSRSKAIMHQLASILAIGRSKAINVLAATQKPTAGIVGSVAKANFTARLVGKVMSPTDAEVAAGISGTQAHFLPGKGSFLFVYGDQTNRFQAYLQDAIDLAAINERWMVQAAMLLDRGRETVKGQ